MGLFPKNLTEYAASLGIPRGPLSKTYIVDPVNGSDSNPGTTWQAPLLTLEAAEDKCVANRHDTVLFLAGATANNPTASITWDKSYTHLIGVGCELPGLGQRCRVVATGATAISPVITFAGNGCMIKNMQFFQEKASGAASGVARVTGNRNLFENVFFATPLSVTAASYSLKLESDENVFKRCTIGQHTYVRTAATHGLWVAGADATRNKFIDCEFLSWSSVTTHALVTIATAVTCEAFTIQFENCLFSNIVSGAGTLAHAIVDGATGTDHQIILRGNNMVLGCGNNICDPVTYAFSGVAAAGAMTGAVAVGH